MDRFYQATAAVLLAVIFGLILSRQSKDWSMIISVIVSCMVLAIAAYYLEPVLDFVRELQSVADLDTDMLSAILKAAGIALVAEIAALICQDAGNAALGKGILMLAGFVVLWLSLPLMRGLLELVRSILGGI